jgi:hypothetical protein
MGEKFVALLVEGFASAWLWRAWVCGWFVPFAVRAQD